MQQNQASSQIFVWRVNSCVIYPSLAWTLPAASSKVLQQVFAGNDSEVVGSTKSLWEFSFGGRVDHIVLLKDTEKRQVVEIIPPTTSLPQTGNFLWSPWRSVSRFTERLLLRNQMFCVTGITLSQTATYRSLHVQVSQGVVSLQCLPLVYTGVRCVHLVDIALQHSSRPFRCQERLSCPKQSFLRKYYKICDPLKAM